MEQCKNILQLIRWSNLLFVGILVYLMEKWVVVPILDNAAFGEQLSWYIVLLIAIGTMLIAAGGYVINDYFDIKIDRINRPDQLIVGQYISKEAAMRLSLVLSGIGIVCGLVCAWLLQCATLGILFAVIPGLLWFYSSSYKRSFMIGNLTVALMAALTPMIVAIANVAQLQLLYSTILPYTSLEHDIYVWVGGFSLFAFLLTWIREIVKDLQDQMGDRELECHSLPVVWGELWTKVFVTVLIVITLGLMIWLWYSVLPFDRSWHELSTRYIVLGIGVPLLGALWLLWAAKIPSDYRTCQQVIKLTMFIGMLYSFVIAQ